MKLYKCGLLLIVLPLLSFTVSCSNFSDVHTDSSSVTASSESTASSATAIDQPWLVNEPVTVSVMSDTQPKTIVSDSAVSDHILSLVGNLSYYETSSEDIQGGCPILILEYSNRRILYTVMNNEYIEIAADGSTKEYRIPKEDGQVLYDYLYKYLRESNV